MYEKLASGGLLDVAQISQYESLLAEGDRALVELDLRWSPPAGAAAELENRLRQEGVEEVRVTTASPMMRIYFRKGFPWLAVIAAAVLVLAILVVGWRLFKEVVAVVPSPIPQIGLILLTGLGLVILIKRRL